MTVRIALDDDLLAELDRRAGAGRRSAFISQERRWDEIEASFGTISDTGHEWDDDPAAWVRRQRRGDDRRSG